MKQGPDKFGIRQNNHSPSTTFGTELWTLDTPDTRLPPVSRYQLSTQHSPLSHQNPTSSCHCKSTTYLAYPTKSHQFSPKKRILFCAPLPPCLPSGAQSEGGSYRSLTKVDQQSRIALAKGPDRQQFMAIFSLKEFSADVSQTVQIEKV
jgi:hypothetical protein